MGVIRFAPPLDAPIDTTLALKLSDELARRLTINGLSAAAALRAAAKSRRDGGTASLTRAELRAVRNGLDHIDVEGPDAATVARLRDQLEHYLAGNIR